MSRRSLPSLLWKAAAVLVVGGLLGVVVSRLSEAAAPEPITRTAPVAAAEAVTTVTTAATTTTTTAPTTTTTNQPPRGTLVIHGVGDVNFDPGYIEAFARHGYEHAFTGLDGLFLEDDLTVINLECSPSPLGEPEPKEFTFRCDPAALPVARRHGVEVANLANNHGQDFGTEAMLDGRARVAAAGLAPVGVGADLAEAMQPSVHEAKGWRVAVLGMGGVVPQDAWLAGPDRPGMASGDDLDQMVAAVERAARVADLVVVTVHWGRELVTRPDPEDRARAEAMIAAGADVIFGHHAHRLGELEMVEGRPVAWTLGNFIWRRWSDAGAVSAVARVVVSPGGELEACLLPVEIETSGHPVLTGERRCEFER